MLNAKSQIYDHLKASDLFTPLAFEDDTNIFLCDDPALSFAFMCNPLVGANESTKDQLGVLLNLDWPEGTILQFISAQLPDIERWMNSVEISRIEKADNSARSKLLLGAMKKQTDFLRASTKRPVEDRFKTRVNDKFIIVTAKVPTKQAEPSRKEFTAVAELQRSSKQVLETMNIAHLSMKDEDLTRLMQVILNHGTQAFWRDNGTVLDEEQMLKYQFLEKDNRLGLDAEGIWLGNPSDKDDRARVKVLSPKRMPREFSLAETVLYAGDPVTGSRGIRCPHLICFNVYFPDSEGVRASMETKKQWVTQQAHGPMLKFAPKLASQKESFDVLFDAVGNGDRLIQYSMSMALFENSAKRATAATSNARAYFRELGFQMMEDKYFCLPLFLNSLPMGAEITAVKELHRYRTAATSHVANLVPICGDWKGTNSPLMQFVSRNGQLMNFDLYDSDSSFNCTVSAQSGSGKSFLINGMISNYLGMGGRVYTIDVGRSYAKLCTAYDGDFVEFTKESHICLNPFPLVEIYEDDADMLLGLICSMAAPTEKVTDYQTSGVRRHLRAVWEKTGKKTIIDDVAASLKSDEDKRIRDIGEQLYPFTTEGEYGRWFCGENNMDFANKFTVLELEELKGRKHLQQIVLLMIIYKIQDDLYRSSLADRGQPRLIFIDEAWEILSEGTESVVNFLLGGFRKARKYGGAFCVITQSVNDLYASPAGIAIAENSPNMLLLGQKPETIDSLQQSKRLSLTDYEYRLLKSVRTVRGVFSEVFIKTDKGNGIGRFIVPRYSQLVYTTHATEVAELQKRMDAGMNLDEAINDYMAYEARTKPAHADELEEDEVEA